MLCRWILQVSISRMLSTSSTSTFLSFMLTSKITREWLQVILNNIDTPVHVCKIHNHTCGTSALITLNGPEANAGGIRCMVTIYREMTFDLFEGKCTKCRRAVITAKMVIRYIVQSIA